MTTWHVYYGTKGTAGAYIDALQRALGTAGQPSRAFVSSCYRFRTNGVIRIFFPLTDRFDHRGSLPRLLRGVELVCAYGLILIAAAVARPVVNLSLNDDFRATWLFFRACKLAGLRVFLTCHDVVAHGGGVAGTRLDMIVRADAVVVHNDSARRTLVSLVGPSAVERVIVLPFPWSSYDSILSAERLGAVSRRWEERLRGRPFLCFLGIVRRSKGIENLLQAWETLEDRHGHQLVIAGRWADVEDLRPLAESLPDCILDDRYVDDEEFAYLIRAATWVILPYLDYTHSSVLLSVLKQGGAMLTSDIPLFREALGDEEWMFEAGSTEGLRRLLGRALGLSRAEVSALRERLASSASDEEAKLVATIRSDLVPRLQQRGGASVAGS